MNKQSGEEKQHEAQKLIQSIERRNKKLNRVLKKQKNILEHFYGKSTLENIFQKKTVPISDHMLKELRTLEKKVRAQYYISVLHKTYGMPNIEIAERVGVEPCSIAHINSYSEIRSVGDELLNRLQSNLASAPLQHLVADVKRMLSEHMEIIETCPAGSVAIDPSDVDSGAVTEIISHLQCSSDATAVLPPSVGGLLLNILLKGPIRAWLIAVDTSKSFSNSLNYFIHELEEILKRLKQIQAASSKIHEHNTKGSVYRHPRSKK